MGTTAPARGAAAPARVAHRRPRLAGALLPWALLAFLAPAAAAPPAVEEAGPPAPAPRAESIETLWARGESALAAGDLDQALRLFTAALAADEGRARTWNYLGGVHFTRGNFEEALRDFRQAFTLDPRDVRACNNLGTALERLGELQRAEITYRRAEQIDPAYAPTQRNLGILAARLGKIGDARRAWQRYLELAPQGAGADEVRRALAALDDPETAPPR